jgi:hypothetical protein
MIVKIKIDKWAQAKLKSRLGMRILSGGKDILSAPELLVLSLTSKEDGDTMDLTEKAGKLQKLLDHTS